MSCLDVLFLNPCHHGDGYYAPIGLQMLHRLTVDAGFSARVIDLQREVLEGLLPWPNGFFAAVDARLANVDARIYAFSVMNVGLPWAVRVAALIKHRRPEAIGVFGGPHVTLLADELLDTFPAIDVAVRNEGERVIAPLIRALLSGDLAALADVPNVVYRKPGGGLHHGPQAPMIGNLDELPLMVLEPDLVSKVPLLSVEAGRGCPFTCSFCSSHAIWTRTPRYKSPRRLVTEVLDYVDRLPPVQRPIISFEHDDFIARPNYFLEFVEAKKALGAEFKYVISTRLDHLKPKIIELLRDSGCLSVFMGLETGEQRIQDSSSKRLRVPRILPTILALRNAGLHFSTNFIIGHPGERREDVVTSLTLMFKLAWLGSSVNISIMCPEPGSALHAQVPASDHRFVRGSAYSADLEAGGIRLIDLTPPERTHLLTIHNQHYDILRMADAATAINGLMTDFRATLYELVERRGLGADGLLRAIDSFQGDGPPLREPHALHAFLCATLESGSSTGRWREFLLYERDRALVKKGRLPCAQRADFDADMPDAYYDARDRIAHDVSEIERPA